MLEPTPSLLQPQPDTGMQIDITTQAPVSKVEMPMALAPGNSQSHQHPNPHLGHVGIVPHQQ